MNSYRIISRKQIEDGTLTFHEVANKFRATAADQAKDNKPSQLAKGSFGPSFASEDTKPASGDACEEGREEAKKQKKKKPKAGKESAEDADSPVEQGRTTKRAVPSSRDHLDDDSRSRSQASKRRQCRACGGFHPYKRCFYLFPTLAPEGWVPRSEIKKVVKEALDEDKNFADEIKQLQIAEEKKKKKKEN